MANYYGYPYIALTGGADNALDSLDGSLLKDGDFAVVVVPATKRTYIYTLDEDSGATEDGLNIISPDANAGDKRWILTNSPSVSSNYASYYGANGNGVENDRTAIAAADAAVTGAIYFSAGTYLISTSLTISSPIVMEPEAKFSIASGQTLTINNNVFSGQNQIFTGDGAVAFGTSSNREVHAEWFGSIQKAVNSLPSSAFSTGTISHGGGVVRFGGTYTISTPVQLRNSIALIGYGPNSLINITGENEGVEFVKTGAEEIVTGCLLKDFAITGDATSNQVGVSAYNLCRSKIENVIIRNCANTGVYMLSNIGTILDNVYVFDCAAGITLTSEADNESNGNTIRECYVSQCSGVGITITEGAGGSKNNRVVSTVSEYNAGNLIIYGGYGNVVDGCYFEGCSSGYSVIIDENADTSELSYGTIIQNCFSMEQYFINVRGANHTRLLSNRTNHASGQITLEPEAVWTKIVDRDWIPVISDSSAFRAEEAWQRSIVMADDSFYAFTMPNAHQNNAAIIAVTSGIAASSGVVFVDPDTPSSAVIAAGAAIAVATGALNGTTGTDAKLTISAHATDKKVYIENRLGGTIQLGFSILIGV